VGECFDFDKFFINNKVGARVGWGRQRTSLLFCESFIQQSNIIIIRRSEVSKVVFVMIMFSEEQKDW